MSFDDDEDDVGGNPEEMYRTDRDDADSNRFRAKWKPDYIRQARKLYSKGWIDREVAELWGVSAYAIRIWRANKPEFAEACALGKAVVDDEIEAALFSRARGYDRASEKVSFDKDGNVLRATVIEHIPPDPKAAMNWLKNRRPDKWKDRREVTGADGAPLHPVNEPRGSKIEIARRVLFLMQQASTEGNSLEQLPHIIEEKVTIHD